MDFSKSTHTVQEVADYYIRCDKTIRNWIKQGKLKAIKTPKDYIITTEAIDEFNEGRIN